ncbi:MAG TPA: DNRLRE domain-containing protein, partial [Phycisphaerae bacterium]|nr:DNRLRE domain-containing protein [Phycisphaerae bacterium]
MFTAKRGWIIAAAAVLLAAGGASAQVTVFQQGVSPAADYAGCKDTWISDNQWEQTRNNAASQTLTCGDKRNILIRFDLSALAKDAKVNKAVLRLWDVEYPRRDRDGSFPSVLGAFRLTREWNDDGTWKHHTRPEQRKEKEPNPALEWKTPGGEMDVETDLGGPAKGLVAVDALMDGPAGHVHELDVTKLVQKWVSGEWPNHGLALVLQGKGRATVAGSDWYVPSARPMLLVACGGSRDVAALTPAPKEVELDAAAGTADPSPKPEADYSVVRVGWNANCALRGGSADAYVKEAAEKYPGNWGWLDMCRVGGCAGDVSRAVMRFDLNGIPKGASVKQATLRLTLAPYTSRQAESYRYGAYLLKLPEAPGWKADEVDLLQRRRGVPWGAGGVVAASAARPVAVGKVISR